MPSPRHKYLLVDPVTDQLLGSMPLTGATYGRRLNTRGTLSATVPLVDQAVGELMRNLAERPLALYALRTPPGGRAAIWWGGLVWTSTPERGRRGPAGAAISGATFDSYPDSRFIWEDLDVSGQDRGYAVAALWDHMQDQSGNSSIDVSSAPVAIGGPTWPGPAWGATTSTRYGEAIAAVTSMEPAFETTVDVFLDADGGRRRELRIGTPLIGDQSRVHLLATPATLVGWSWPVDHTIRGTNAIVRGSQTGKAIGGDVVAVTSELVTNEAAVAAGVLRVDVTDDMSWTEDTARLTDRARQLTDLRARKPSVTVRLPQESGWHPGLLGDMGRVSIIDPTFPGGHLDTIARVIGVQVKPATRGQDEEVTFEFQPEDAA